MVGKNPLWVAKQHGHSIATMLRAYAAWVEGTAEVDVEAIKRSMNASEAPPEINLAVVLSVAEALQARRVLTTRPTRTSHSCAKRLFRKGELAVNQPRKVGWGGRIIRPCGPHPFGAALRALSFLPWLEPRATQTRRITESDEFWLGWKDSNLRMAGSKPSIGPNKINNLLTILEIRFPSTPLGSPSLSLELSIGAVTSAHEIR